MLNTILAFIFFSLILISCNNDSTNNAVANAVNIEGTWIINTFTYANSKDLDKDGTSSKNLLTEVNCYKIDVTFNNDGSYTLKRKDIEYIIAKGSCGNDESDTGYYAINGNKINLYKTTADKLIGTNKKELEFIIVEQHIEIRDTHSPLGNCIRKLKRK